MATTARLPSVRYELLQRYDRRNGSLVIGLVLDKMTLSPSMGKSPTVEVILPSRIEDSAIQKLMSTNPKVHRWHNLTRIFRLQEPNLFQALLD